MSLLWVCFFQTIAISWIFGAQKFIDCVQQMMGIRPNKFWYICWVFFAPVVMLVSCCCTQNSPGREQHWYYKPFNKRIWCSCDRASLIRNDLLDQLDATIMIYWWTNNSTCFGHHCVHLQECKAVHYCVRFSALKVMAGVLGRLGLALPKMDAMVPETFWVIGSSINHNCCIKLV